MLVRIVVYGHAKPTRASTTLKLDLLLSFHIHHDFAFDLYFWVFPTCILLCTSLFYIRDCFADNLRFLVFIYVFLNYFRVLSKHLDSVIE